MNSTFVMRSITAIIILFSFFSCSKEYKVPEGLEVYDFTWKGLNAYYLYQDQIADLSDRRFSSDQQLNAYLSDFSDPNDLFNSLLISWDTKSTLIPDYTVLTDPAPRASVTHGMEFGIIADPGSTENVIGYVLDILPGSDAASKSIVRGDFFTMVDGVQLTRTNYAALLVNGANTYQLSMASFDGTVATLNGSLVTLAKANYTHVPVAIEKTFTIGANTIGYLKYDNDFSGNYMADINTSFLNFKNQNINQLILDFRYSIGTGAYARDMAKLGAMVTGQFNDQPFARKRWNTKAQPWFEANQPDSLLVAFPTSLGSTVAIQNANLTDVYIIMNGTNFSGSSALELLINSLRAHINVWIVGNQSTGNDTGSITLYNSQDYDFEGRSMNHTYALQPVVLNFLNSKNETYENGFAPNMTLCAHEDILNLGVLGETSDPVLNNTLNFVTTGSPTTPTCNPASIEFIYNSINAQRAIDRGVFIQQNLPNTN
jgi:C-terminal processing protease CtpA/Prc